MKPQRNNPVGVSLAWLIFIVGMMLASQCRADEIFFRTGADFIHAKAASTYSLGFKNFVDEHFFIQADGGFWLDSGFLHKNAIFASVQFGGRLGDREGWHFDLSMGPMFQSGTDYVLGSALQWTEDALIGYRNVSAGVKHISNANIIPPNLGRNFIMIQYSVPFGN